MTPEELHAELRRRTKNPHVIERILRLNPRGAKEGHIPRGWRDGDRGRRERWAVSRFLTKGQVIRKHGRAAWDAIPREHIEKMGRREYVGWAAAMVHVIQHGIVR